MTNTSTDRLQHERFCLPRPGETEVRTESYTGYRDVDGRSIPIPVTRCMECAAMVVDGQPVG